ncbi:MAG: DNA topoisomerase IV subunit A [Actinomycetota bacterium]
MSPRNSQPPQSPSSGGTIVDIDVSAEMRGSFLEYSYSVIHSRALPDARDGLKPVHRRILFQMAEMGLRPDRGHVKSARVVGEVMGKLHPHGDSAIYEALVRMAQPFSMRLPLVDGHGNFGSLGNDDPPAAMRYTECRLASAARLMTDSLDEDVVDMVPNYDEREREPSVLPAAYPNLLVNGAAGIAVGMATNMAPHNLVEVIAAARHLLANPRTSLDDVMRFIPGPDLPTGGVIVGLDGVREAYECGRGTFRTRAAAQITDVSSRRRGIVVTELPYNVGPEKVIAKIKELTQAKKLQGISDVKDLTDRQKGLRLVIECKPGFNPEAVLAELYRLTPMEETFGINAVALVDGQPRTLGLLELLHVYVDHRLDVVRRRCAYRRRKAQDRAHLVEGLLLALANIDEVVQVIRTSQDTEEAKRRLMEIFDLTEVQTVYILDMPLRRLVALEVLKLTDELAELHEAIAELTRILDSDAALRELVSDELAEVAATYGTPRRTRLREAVQVPTSAVPLEVADGPCRVLLSSTGLLARIGISDESAARGNDTQRSRHDVVVSWAPATTRGMLGAVTDLGRLVKLEVVDLPGLPPVAGPLNVRGGAPVAELLDLVPGEHVLALVTLGDEGPWIAVGTASGVVKRVNRDFPAKGDAFEVIRLDPGDRVVGVTELTTGEEDLVFITSDAQLLRTPAAGVRPQGRSGGGVAGIKCAPGERVVFFAGVEPAEALVVSVSGSTAALPGTETGSTKVTPLGEYPYKGRATGGVRCHRFLRGEDTLLRGWAGPAPAQAATVTGEPVSLPLEVGRRDGSGVAVAAPIAAVAAVCSW